MNSFKNHYIPEETEDLRKWHSDLAESFLKDIGIDEDSYVLDFGCGAGNYTLPAARIVKENGRIFAVDKEQIVILEIEEKAKQYKLTDQILALKTSGEFSFPIQKETIDIALIFDVVGNIVNQQGTEGIKQLVKEVSNLLKSGGKLILAMKHTNNWKVPKQIVINIIQNYFVFEKEVTMKHLHWDYLEEGLITFFTKKE